MLEHEHADLRAILERIKGYYGLIPQIYQELQRNPAAFGAFFHKNEQLATDTALPGLTKELIAIRAAAVLGSEYCLETHVEGANVSAPWKIRSFSRYCLGHPLPRVRRCQKFFARGKLRLSFHRGRDAYHVHRLPGDDL